MTRILSFGYLFFFVLLGIPSLFISVSSATVNFHEIFGTLITLAVVFFLLFSKNKITLSFLKASIVPLLVLIIVLLCDLLSFIGLLNNFELSALSQFSKSIIYRILFFIILFSYILYSAITRFMYAEQHLKVFALIVAASSLYQFIAIAVFLTLGESLDETLWPLLTAGSWEPWEQDMRLGGEEIPFTFIRHGGFAGNPNILVLQILAVFPLVSSMKIISTSSVNTLISCIFVISLVLTMSRSALIGLGVVAALLILRLLIKLRFNFKSIAVFAVLSPLLGYSALLLFGADALMGFYDLFTYRLRDFSYWDTPRGQLTTVGLGMYADAPIFGTGAGTSPVWLSKYSIAEVTGSSLHNFWLQKMVELGVFSLGHVLVFVLYFSHASRRGFGFPFLLSIMPLAVIGLSNNALSHPFVLSFFTVFAMYVCGARGVAGTNAHLTRNNDARGLV